MQMKENSAWWVFLYFFFFRCIIESCKNNKTRDSEGKYMEEALSCIGRMPIFSGIAEEELYTLIKCCDGQMAVFEKDQWIFQAGEELGYIMVVLKGCLVIIQEDFWHEQKEAAYILPGEIFGEGYASAGNRSLHVSIKAAENSEVLFLDYERSLTFCTMACPFHSLMVHNLIKIMSGNKSNAEEKLEHISQKTTRDKLRSYLSSKALQEGSNRFDIPLNRQELADYLGVDRSAMSSELGKMKAEGILDFKKNHFVLK